MEFPSVSTDGLVAWPRSFFILIKPFWREGIFLIVLLKARHALISKTSDTKGGNIRSADALRPSTLCICDCKLLTSAFVEVFTGILCNAFTLHRCISTRQMEDKIFEIETITLAHVACAPQDAGVLLTFCRCIFQCQSVLDLLGAREHWIARLSLPLPTKHSQGQHYTCGIFGRQGCLVSCFFLQWPLTRFSDSSKNQLSQRTWAT